MAFKPVEYVPGGLENKPPLNVLWIGMKPQNMYLQLSTNSAGDKFDLEPTVLSGEVDDGPLRPYGEILNEIFRGDPILSVRGGCRGGVLADRRPGARCMGEQRGPAGGVRRGLGRADRLGLNRPPNHRLYRAKSPDFRRSLLRSLH